MVKIETKKRRKTHNFTSTSRLYLGKLNFKLGSIYLCTMILISIAFQLSTGCLGISKKFNITIKYLLFTKPIFFNHSVQNSLRFLSVKGSI